MDDLQTTRRAAELAGVSRNAISRWVKAGLLKGKPSRIGNMYATLVSVRAVKELAKTRRPGRPAKEKGRCDVAEELEAFVEVRRVKIERARVRVPQRAVQKKGAEQDAFKEAAIEAAPSVPSGEWELEGDPAYSIHPDQGIIAWTPESLARSARLSGIG